MLLLGNSSAELTKPGGEAEIVWEGKVTSASSGRAASPFNPGSQPAGSGAVVSQAACALLMSSCSVYVWGCHTQEVS